MLKSFLIPQKLRFLALFLAVGLLLLLGPDSGAQAGTFPDSPDVHGFPTSAIFRVLSLDGTVDESYTVYDNLTTVSTSAPDCRYFDDGVYSEGFDACRSPIDFLDTATGYRRFVETKIEDLNLNDAGGLISIKAGFSYSTSPTALFYQESPGLVMSKHPYPCDPVPPRVPCLLDTIPGGCAPFGTDFPAGSYYNVFVEVTTIYGTFSNYTPMVVQATIDKFPPDLDLPDTWYMHDPNFAAVPLFDENGTHWGYLLSAGHGGEYGLNPPDFANNAPMMISIDQPVLFTVDSLSAGLSASLSYPNHVRNDLGAGTQQVTVYQSSGENPGAGPDVTNIRVDELVGSIGGPTPPDFEAQDAINSISFGRDGTIDSTTGEKLTGALYFSVNRGTDGEDCSDVWYAANEDREPGAVFVSRQRINGFGDYSSGPVPKLPGPYLLGDGGGDTIGVQVKNELVVDGTALGLKPSASDTLPDNLTGLEISTYQPGYKLYATFTGSSFDGQTATIFIYDPALPFTPANLVVFATAADLHLTVNDTINGLCVSDVTVDTTANPDTVIAIPNGTIDPYYDEVLYTLTPGSPSLSIDSRDPGDVFFFYFGVIDPWVFASAPTLGLLTTEHRGFRDDVDALDILAAYPYTLIQPVVTPTIGIEKTHNTIQGGHEFVSITLEDNPIEFGGFDFLIAYDASALALQAAVPGPAFYDPAPDGCGWEYFNYRYGPFGNCGDACPSGMVRILALAETNNGANHPSCFIPDSLPAVMFSLDFLVSNDRTLECQYVPIRFFWTDCGDNAISSVDGEVLYVSDHVYEFEGTEITDPTFGFPTYFGVQPECLNPDPDKPTAIQFFDFVNGGVDIICADSIDDRGDINLNGTANEIADAVLFSNYFVHGISVFNVNIEGQIAASDVNADGITLSVADLVYLIRIIVGDAPPYPKLTPVLADADIVNGILSVGSEMGAAYVVVENSITPQLLTESMEMKYNYDEANNLTRILVYSMEADQAFSGNFLGGIEGNVITLEMATYDGAPVTTKLIPEAFALYPCYPNPFNPLTTISFALASSVDYELVIYNALGQTVKTYSGHGGPGLERIDWNASGFASGVYFYRLTAGDFTDTKKMVLLK